MSIRFKASFRCLGGQMGAVAGVQCSSVLSASMLQHPFPVENMVCESVGVPSPRLKEVGSW